MDRRVLLLVLAGCDQLFGLDVVDHTRDASLGDVAFDAPDNCIRDTFSNPAIDQRWEPFAEDGALSVELMNGQLVIDLSQAVLLGRNGEAGVRTFGRYDLRDGAVSIEVPRAVTSTTHQVENYLEVRGDFLNRYTMGVAGGRLSFVRTYMGIRSATDRAYNASQHRFWRIANPPGTTRITFSTSEGTEWTEQTALDMAVPVDSVVIGLVAGTFNSGDATPGYAAYDNLVLCATPR